MTWTLCLTKGVMSISETPKEGFELRLDNNAVREEFEFELLVVLGK